MGHSDASEGAARVADVELADLVLTGPRLTLRPWRQGDEDDVFAALHDDASAARFTAVPVPYTREVAHSWVTEVGNAGRRDGTEIGCAVINTATGSLVGSAAIRLHGPVGDIGYLVFRGHRGNGYAAEATRVLAGWALEHGIGRVELACDVRNLASVRTALSAGMSFEGVSRQVPLLPRTPDRIVDLARFSRLATDPDGPVAPRFAPLPSGGLTDGVIALRCLAEDDVDAVLETEDPVTVASRFDAQPRSRDVVARRCREAGLDWLVGSVAMMAIVDVASGRYAGSLQLRASGPPQVGGIGYVVHPAFRGRGFTARALRLLAPWAFDTGGFARLELGAKVGNVASQRAAFSGGFEPDGVRAARLRNADGTFSDEVRFALVRKP